MTFPAPTGLYDPRFEHDACGVGFVADLKGRPSHEMLTRALTCLVNLDHRGATGAEANVGDGAGVLTQIPHLLFAADCDFALPSKGAYAAGIAFLPREPEDADKAAAAMEAIVADEGL